MEKTLKGWIGLSKEEEQARRAQIKPFEDAAKELKEQNVVLKEAEKLMRVAVKKIKEAEGPMSEAIKKIKEAGKG